MNLFLVTKRIFSRTTIALLTASTTLALTACQKDFDYFQIIYDENNYGDFHKEEDTLIEFREDHIKETCENGDVIYWNYSNICKIAVFKNEESKENKATLDEFDDDDLWTGNRIQF